jgi:hypothetical protein
MFLIMNLFFEIDFVRLSNFQPRLISLDDFFFLWLYGPFYMTRHSYSFVINRPDTVCVIVGEFTP